MSGRAAQLCSRQLPPAQHTVNMVFSWKVAGVSLASVLCAALLVPSPSSASVVLTPGFHPNNAAPGTGSASNHNQTVVIGTAIYPDRLLLRETAYAEGKFLRVSDADIFYPKAGDPGLAKISAIKVLDQQRDGNNGEVKLKTGGVGYNNAHLRFHSQRGSGMHYVVEIYGH